MDCLQAPEAKTVRTSQGFAPPDRHTKPLGASEFAQQSQGFANAVFLMPYLQKLTRAKHVRTYRGFRPSAPQMNPLGGL